MRIIRKSFVWGDGWREGEKDGRREEATVALLYETKET